MSLTNVQTANQAANPSFETPSVGANAVSNPVGASWTFVGDAGIAGNGSSLTGANPNAPLGVQVGFIPGNGGVIRQTVTLAAGTYTLAFKAAQGGQNKGVQQLRVTIEKTGLPTSVQRFVYNGNTIAEERDSTGATVTKRFFAEGEWRLNSKGDGKYYYTRDHLGSIREVTNSSGVLQARYDYDLWGNSVVVNGTMSLDFGYTGHYFHAPSGLNLTLFRMYIPSLGRWGSRDPIGEAGGINLYAYVSNNPVKLVDPLGDQAAAAGGIALGIEEIITGGAVTQFVLQLIKESCEKKKCPPCNPPVGTVGYRLDSVPPSRPHGPFPGDHVHLYQMNQNPNNCQCFWVPIGVTAPPPPPGAVPLP